jgi:branched-chain amino acid transport system ATP-binding protein
VHPILEVESLERRFGALRAVDGISFSVAEGEILGIAGPNGSGKSTLFNCLTGVPFHASGGTVRFKGRNITGVPPHRICHQGLARTFQREAIFPSLSVQDNVMLAAHYGGGDETGVDEALAFVGMAPQSHGALAGDISLFDKKRLAIASAIVTAPRLLLLDEPASGLSKPEVAELAALIRRVNARGVTIILVEHVLSLLLDVSQRLLVLEAGKLIAVGEPAAVMREPRVVEAYLGRRASQAHALT